MYAVANEQGGTSYRYLHNLDVKVAAKTGTAQVVGFSQTDKNRVDENNLSIILDLMRGLLLMLLILSQNM